MQAYRLVPHPTKPPLGVSSIEARIDMGHPHWVQARWRIETSGALKWPPPAGQRRRDGLWKTTCFEIFVKSEGNFTYREFNLSPSEGWNVYDFDTYREGMREPPVQHAPVCTMRPGGRFAIFDAAVPRSLVPRGPSSLGLSAVIEEEGGIKSYWAIAHPDAPVPDFHHAACFAGTLLPPQEA